MTWDLWDPPHIQGAPESSIDMQLGCQHDFHGGYGVDLLEENAANELACVQVLQILVRKADDEIDELEKHLVCLQSELACFEYEEWPNICCNALKEKIDYFCVSLKWLRCRDQDDSGAHSNVNEEPTERMHDMVKTLLRSHCHEKNQKHELSLQTVDESPSTDAVDDTSVHSDSDAKQRKEPHRKALISEPSSTTIKSSSLSALRDETTHNGNMVKRCEPKLEVSDDVEHGNCSAIDRSRIFNQPLKLQESTAKSVEPPDTTTEYTVPDPSIHDGDCNQRTKICNTGTGILPANNRNPDEEPRYSNQMLKIALNDVREEPRAALAKKQALPSSSLIVSGENRNADTESSALTSMVEIGDQKSEHVIKTDRGEEEQVSTAVKLQDDASVADRSNLIQSKMPKKQKGKREIEQNVLNSKILQQVEIAPSASLSNTIGGRMFGIVNECTNVNKPLTRKILKEFVLAIHSETKHPTLVPDVSTGLVSQQERKRQKTSDTVTSMGVTHAQVKMGDLEAEVSGSGCKAKPLMIKHEKSDDVDNELGILWPPAEVSLESLKVNDLRAIAKEYKLRNYSKLKKKVLVEQIANKVGRC
ncbi:Rho_N domain-containing protein [Psidium guajava]|nr:Rho_N domain-containing protein [Psidium guajava]